MGKTRLIIVRHGNTFRSGETPTRVGAKTDLPLVEEEKGRSVGRYFRQHHFKIDAAFAAPLLRTTQTAQLILSELQDTPELQILDSFTEIDYGPDENKTEDEVCCRLGNGDIDAGKAIIEAWNRDAIVPTGWHVDPAAIIHNWKFFGVQISQHKQEESNILVVSSNGIIRFAPYLTGNFEQFSKEYSIKVSTGAVCIFEKENEDQNWRCTAWNLKIK